jgi:putative colanic acid biosynthesis acetyltransferase WcaF
MYLIKQARRRPYRIMEYLKRIIWYVFSLFFRYSPRTSWYFRNTILRINGAKISRNVRIYRSVKIHSPWRFQCKSDVTIGENVYIYNLGELVIKRNTTISFKSQIIGGGHDIRKPHLPLERYNITIGSNVFIGANVHLLGEITIGDNIVLGYGTILTKSITSPGVYYSKVELVKKEL